MQKVYGNIVIHSLILATLSPELQWSFGARTVGVAEQSKILWRTLGNLRAENSISFLWFYDNLDHRIKNLTQLLKAILLGLQLQWYTVSKWCSQLRCTSQSMQTVFCVLEKVFLALQFTQLIQQKQNISPKVNKSFENSSLCIKKFIIKMTYFKVRTLFSDTTTLLRISIIALIFQVHFLKSQS